MTRFIDSNVFIHAILQPNRALKPHETEIKESAKKIITRISEGELVTTSTSHVSEIANILEARMGLEQASKVIQSITGMTNVHIFSVESSHVRSAAIVAPQIELGFNDTIAYLLMQENKVSEIYSYDKDFDNIKTAQRIHT